MNNLDEVVIACGGAANKRLIRHFNPLDFANPQKEYSGVFQQIPERFDNYLYALGQLVNCPLPYDRTERFNTFNYHITPIWPFPDGWNNTFEEVFLQRAASIWTKNKPVRLWWSGGIDSTTVLVALLRTKKPEHELIVYMGDPCVEENPNMYDKIKKMDDVKIQWNDASNIWSFNNFTDGTINVTGEPGDPFYGTYVVENHIDEINNPWTDMFQWEDVNLVIEPENFPKFMEFAEIFNSKCPFEVKTVFDFTWWLAFAIKWQWIVARMYPFMVNPSRWQNMISFYNCDTIQWWSIINHDLKHKGTWKSYKWPSKEFIFNYNKDADYRDNKVKERSMPKTLPDHNGYYNLHLLMTSGEYFNQTEEEVYGIKGIDPNLALINKWEIFNEDLWKKWKKML